MRKVLQDTAGKMFTRFAASCCTTASQRGGLSEALLVSKNAWRRGATLILPKPPAPFRGPHEPKPCNAEVQGLRRACSELLESHTSLAWPQ